MPTQLKIMRAGEICFIFISAEEEKTCLYRLIGDLDGSVGDLKDSCRRRVLFSEFSLRPIIAFFEDFHCKSSRAADKYSEICRRYAQ